MTRLWFGKDVKGSDRGGSLAGGKKGTGLTVGEVQLKVEKGRITGELAVANPTASPIRLVAMPYGGAFPYGGEHPFTLAFADPAVTYAGALYPPEPPAPMLIDFPPRTEVVFTSFVDLADWSWKGAPEVALRWGFHSAQGPLREGTVKVRLGTR